ncbi:MBOAT family O-acyltransferase [Paucidesulfovibrio longus]|uniref:MBOAT family O-acyltransferase n=1 Tax=Paucidesulfovibrio longus TaxID=889 RepID=UPI0003B40E2B|nr:MBOAT family O-acyltransferase [Paucidesulfovibrio longus]
MLFNSLGFAAFFLLTAWLHFVVPRRYAWVPLLVASYYFYMSWRPVFGLLLLASTLVNYVAALRMAALPGKPGRGKYLLLCLVFNLGLLFVFKYFNFFSRSLADALAVWGLAVDPPLLDMLLPVGISFYTFQVLGYVIDVYEERIEAERHPGIFALFVAFWPQLLAGPINRAKLLLPQFRPEAFRTRRFDAALAVDGLRQMLWGLFKKVVIADNLALHVNHVFNHAGELRGLPVVLAAVFYTVQIYCDFSGYTDVALGAARFMGFRLTENFDRPYFARSVREFWQRWHISLSTWFRDYVYIPLGGSRVAAWRRHLNILLTFLLSGLWHGADWTFVVWGGLHGAVLVLENATGGFQKRLADRLFPLRAGLNNAVQVGLTMTLVCLAWVFFRADSLAQALTVLRSMAPRAGGPLLGDGPAILGGWTLLFHGALVLLLVGVELAGRPGAVRERVARWPLTLRWLAYSAGAWAVALCTVFGVRQEFIYFQF